MTREIYKKVGDDWNFFRVKDLVVGDIVSIHDEGKHVGIFKIRSAPEMDERGNWMFQVQQLKGA